MPPEPGRRASCIPEPVIPPAQADTAALLERLAGTAPTLTHISAVFAGADTVWKLRLAVTLPFLDFSGLAERERTAWRELDLNAAAAPGLYRDVVPVTRASDGTLALDGGGEAVDWVVRMARVPAGDFLDQLTADGRLTPVLLDGIADAVAALHAVAPVVERRPDLLAVARGNAEAARSAGLEPAAVDRWLATIEPRIDTLQDWTRRRTDAGFVRRGHGDLHLGNLCLWRGKPVPFDALEFDEDLASIDLGYDLAFLLMDLDRRAGRPAANRAMNRYLARTGDWDLVPGLPTFLSTRAMIRAHVAARRGQPQEAAGYLALAFAYLDPPPPCVVAIGGLPGTGKSTLARALAPELGAGPGAVVLRSDEIRKRRHGAAPEQRLPESAYSAAASTAVFDEMAAAAAALHAAGHAVIADAAFLDPATRKAIAAAGAPFLGLWLEAPLPVLEARVAARTGDASDATIAVLRRAAAAPPVRDWTAVSAIDAGKAVAAASKLLDPGNINRNKNYKSAAGLSRNNAPVI